MGGRGVVAALVFAAGCGFPAAKLDEARGHVGHALEVWQAGGKPGDLAAGTPPVAFHEAMWNAGDKLIAYELEPAGYVEAEGVVRCPARLTVRGRNGKDRAEAAVYDVTLGPPVKVVNNPMP